MTDHHEIELKYALENEKQLEELIKLVNGTYITTHHQTNHFFLPESFRRPYLLRLRQEDQNFILAAKGGGSKDGVLSIRQEEETLLTEEEAAKLLTGKASPAIMLMEKRADLLSSPFGQLILADSKKYNFKYAGCFKNLRRIYSYTLEKELLLEFDKTTFPHEIVNCELEIEVDEDLIAPVQAHFNSLLSENGIQIKSVPSKANRFFNYL